MQWNVQLGTVPTTCCQISHPFPQLPVMTRRTFGTTVIEDTIKISFFFTVLLSLWVFFSYNQPKLNTELFWFRWLSVTLGHRDLKSHCESVKVKQIKLWDHGCATTHRQYYGNGWSASKPTKLEPAPLARPVKPHTPMHETYISWMFPV